MPTLNAFAVGLDDLGEEDVLVTRPIRVRKDLDLVEPVKPGGFDPPANLLQRDAAFAHQSAVEEEIGGGRFPIADVIREKLFCAAAARDLLLERGIPPEVIDVDGNAHPRR